MTVRSAKRHKLNFPPHVAQRSDALFLPKPKAGTVDKKSDSLRFNQLVDQALGLFLSNDHAVSFNKHGIDPGKFRVFTLIWPEIQDQIGFANIDPCFSFKHGMSHQMLESVF